MCVYTYVKCRNLFCHVIGKIIKIDGKYITSSWSIGHVSGVINCVPRFLIPVIE